MEDKKPQVVEDIRNPVKRERRRRSEDPMPEIRDRIIGMALSTRSLKKTAENLIVRESQVAFDMALYAIDLLHARRDGFGTPLIKKSVSRELTVRDARQLTIYTGKAVA